MKANELMIGDWIAIDEPDRYAGATGQIKSLQYHQEGDAAYFHVFIQGKFGYVLREVCSDDIRPIPLTPEILEKNGWIKDGYFYRAKDGSYIQLGQLFEHATFSCEKYGINRDVFTSPSMLKYVHQLQHALRLCGIEKEIEL